MPIFFSSLLRFAGEPLSLGGLMQYESKQPNEQSSGTTPFDLNREFNDDLSHATIDPEHSSISSLDANASDSPSLSRRGYQIIRLLGRGGMGIVYEAIELNLNRRVAVKVLPAASLVDPNQITRFKNEAFAVGQLDHENIVQIYQVGSEQGIHFYSMQLIDGQNLSQIISSIRVQVRGGDGHILSETPKRGFSKTKDSRKKQDRPDGHPPRSSGAKKLTVEDFVAAFSSRRGSGQGLALYKSIACIGAEIADALAHAHDQGVVHRDIKPSNILIDANGKPWVTDFGLAMIRNNPAATRPGDIVGTYQYMSPEQASGRRFLIDHRTDIYSLGVTLYEMLTLSVPFHGSDPKELMRQISFEEPKSIRTYNPSIPPELEIIVTKAISKNPNDRYETASDFADDLRRFVSDKAIQAKPASMAKRVRRWISAHQVLALATAIVLLFTLMTSLTASGMIWLALQSEKEQRELTEDTLEQADGLRLMASAGVTQEKNPGLALCLAMEGANHCPGAQADATLLAALSANHEQHTLYLRDYAETSVDISRNGRMAVVATREIAPNEPAPAHLIDVASGKQLRTLGDRKTITSVVFNPSGNYVLSASAKGPMESSGAAVLWDVLNPASGTTLVDSCPIQALRDAFSSDGRLVVTPSLDHTASVYECSTGEARVRFRGHQAPVMSAVLSRNGQQAASIDSAGTVFVWDVENGSPHFKYDTGRAYSFESSVSFSPDGLRLIVVDEKGTKCFVLNKAQAAQPLKWRENHIAVHPFLTQAACYWTVGRRVYIRNLKTAETLFDFVLPSPPQSIVYSSDGRFLLATCLERICCIDCSTGNEVLRFNGHQGEILAAAVDDSFKTMITTGMDKTVRIWSRRSTIDQDRHDVASWLKIPTNGTFDFQEEKLAISTSSSIESSVIDGTNGGLRRIGDGESKRTEHSKGRSILIEKNTVRLVDVESLRKISETVFSNSPIMQALPCGDSDNILVHLEDQTLHLWDSAENIVSPVKNRGVLPHTVGASHDGRFAAIGNYDGICEIYSIAERRMVHSIPHEMGIASLYWSRDFGLFTVDTENLIRQWSSDFSQPTRVFQHAENASTEVIVLNHQKKLIGYHGWMPKKMICWDLVTGEVSGVIDGFEKGELTCHENKPLCAISSMVSGTHLWDLESDKSLSITQEPSACSTFLDDELFVGEIGASLGSVRHSTLLQSSGVSNIRVYDVANGQPVRSIPVSFRPMNFSVDISKNELLVSYSAWKVAVCNRETGSIEYSPSFSAPVTVVASIPSRQSWAVASIDGSVYLLDSNGRRVRAFDSAPDPIVSGAVSPDGLLFATGDVQGSVRIIELETGKTIQQTQLHTAHVKQIQFGPASNTVVSLGEDKRFLQFDLRTLKTSEFVSKEGIHSFTLTKTGKNVLLIEGADFVEVKSTKMRNDVSIFKSNAITGMAQWIDLSTMKSTQIFPEIVTAGTVLSDHESVALLTQEGNIVIIDPATQQVLRTIKTATRQPIAIASSRNGSLIATLSKDVSVAVWNSELGQLVSEFENRTRSVLGQDAIFRHQWKPFADNDDWLMKGGQALHALPIGLEAFAKKHAPRMLTEDERERYQVDRIPLTNASPGF